MATTLPTSFPTARQSQAYTPPNSQPNQQIIPHYPSNFPQRLPQQPPQFLQQFPQQHPSGLPAMDSSSQTSQTPMNLSPASPSQPSVFQNLPLANRQLRPPKSPMYVPAALRPTERRNRPSPLTPPRSIHGSTDSLDNAENRPASKRSTTNSSALQSALGKLSEDEPSAPSIPTADLPEVTDPPTRKHWKPDASATVCDAPVCQKYFNLFERRHHCRHCGNVFCGEHSLWTIPLDQNADFHPEGFTCRSCGHCWGEYGRWVEERREMAQEGDRGEVSKSSSRPINKGGKGPEGQRGSIAQSLTRDWNWSTF
ncbi:hypothetical protein N7G274_008362 [Stereocaulon virgatum]|uniref:FYVE-type domain-containing protein n=1 Tax=Stereocaulon virgatum TaxID=373712 RepID=A0ABR3ZYX9_9LECA